MQSSFFLYNFTLCGKEKVVLLQAVTSQKQQFTSSLADQCFYWGAAMIRSQNPHCYKRSTVYIFLGDFVTNKEKSKKKRKIFK